MSREEVETIREVQTIIKVGNTLGSGVKLSAIGEVTFKIKQEAQNKQI